MCRGIKQDRVENDGEVDREGPLLHEREVELLPPEVNDGEKKRCSPAEMEDGYLVFVWGAGRTGRNGSEEW